MKSVLFQVVCRLYGQISLLLRTVVAPQILEEAVLLEVTVLVVELGPWELSLTLLQIFLQVEAQEGLLFPFPWVHFEDFLISGVMERRVEVEVEEAPYFSDSQHHLAEKQLGQLVVAVCNPQ